MEAVESYDLKVASAQGTILRIKASDGKIYGKGGYTSPMSTSRKIVLGFQLGLGTMAVCALGIFAFFLKKKFAERNRQALLPKSLKESFDVNADDAAGDVGVVGEGPNKEADQTNANALDCYWCMPSDSTTDDGSLSASDRDKTIPDLPEGWLEGTDTRSGKKYYCNPSTGASSWVKPTDMGGSDYFNASTMEEEEVEIFSLELPSRQGSDVVNEEFCLNDVATVDATRECPSDLDGTTVIEAEEFINQEKEARDQEPAPSVIATDVVDELIACYEKSENKVVRESNEEPATIATQLFEGCLEATVPSSNKSNPITDESSWANDCVVTKDVNDITDIFTVEDEVEKSSSLELPYCVSSKDDNMEEIFTAENEMGETSSSNMKDGLDDVVVDADVRSLALVGKPRGPEKCVEKDYEASSQGQVPTVHASLLSHEEHTNLNDVTFVRTEETTDKVGSAINQEQAPIAVESLLIPGDWASLNDVPVVGNEESTNRTEKAPNQELTSSVALSSIQLEGWAKATALDCGILDDSSCANPTELEGNDCGGLKEEDLVDISFIEKEDTKESLSLDLPLALEDKNDLNIEKVDLNDVVTVATKRPLDLVDMLDIRMYLTSGAEESTNQSEEASKQGPSSTTIASSLSD